MGNGKIKSAVHNALPTFGFSKRPATGLKIIFFQFNLICLAAQPFYDECALNPIIELQTSSWKINKFKELVTLSSLISNPLYLVEHSCGYRIPVGFSVWVRIYVRNKKSKIFCDDVYGWARVSSSQKILETADEMFEKSTRLTTLGTGDLATGCGGLPKDFMST